VKRIRQVPGPLLTVVVVILMGAASVVTWAARESTGKSSYEFAKDIVLPLVSPLVSILIPTVLFYVIPLSQNRQKAAIELFTSYFDKEMKEARVDAWDYYVTERLALPVAQQDLRLDSYLRFVTDPTYDQQVPKDQHTKMQSLGQVLNYFVIVNAGLEAGLLDKTLTRAFVVHYYLWWREEVFVKLRSRPVIQSRNPRFRPLWFDDLVELDKIAEPVAAAGRSRM